MNAKKRQPNQAEIELTMNALVSLILIGGVDDYYLMNPDRIFDNKELLGKMFSMWELDEQEDTAGNIDWYCNIGHRYLYEEQHKKLSGMKNPLEHIAAINDDAQLSYQLEIVHYYLDAAPAGGIAALDYSWIVFKSWAGCTLGHITETDKRTYVDEVMQRIKNSYRSWEEYVLSFIIGRVYTSSRLSSDFVRNNKAAIYKLTDAARSPYCGISLWH